MLAEGDNRTSVNSALLLGTNTMKIQYLTTNFVRKLRIQNPEMSTNEVGSESFEINQQYANDQALLQYFNHDLVLLPFFFDDVDIKPSSLEARVNDNHKHIYEKNAETGMMESLCGCSSEKRCVLVSVKVLENMVDLFDKEYRDNDSK